jgi:hypothetical protein
MVSEPSSFIALVVDAAAAAARLHLDSDDQNTTKLKISPS